MPSEGPNSPGTMADDAGVGTNTWSNVDNAKVSDDSKASVLNEASEQSHYLKATNFGFSIPSTATIDGIVVEVERSASGAGDTEDLNVRIVKDDAIKTEEKAAAGAWPGTDEIALYGGSTDKWNETWTPADINSPNFGAAISCEETEGKDDSDTGNIDHIRITVYFTEAVVGEALTISRRVSRQLLQTIS